MKQITVAVQVAEVGVLGGQPREQIQFVLDLPDETDTGRIAGAVASAARSTILSTIDTVVAETLAGVSENGTELIQ